MMEVVIYAGYRTGADSTYCGINLDKLLQIYMAGAELAWGFSLVNLPFSNLSLLAIRLITLGEGWGPAQAPS